MTEEEELEALEREKQRRAEQRQLLASRSSVREESKTPEILPEVTPLEVQDALPVLLNKAIAAANSEGAEAKDILPVLLLLQKMGHMEHEKDRVHDIRVIMGVMCEGCMNKLKGMVIEQGK